MTSKTLGQVCCERPVTKFSFGGTQDHDTVVVLLSYIVTKIMAKMWLVKKIFKNVNCLKGFLYVFLNNVLQII